MSEIVEFPVKENLNTYIYLPVTMQQFEDLTNSMLKHVNDLMKPHALDADYMARVLMSAIHAIDHKNGKVRKNDLFEACVNRVSCHVTYHADQEIQKRIKAKSDETGEEVMTVPLEPQEAGEILPDEVKGQMPPPPDTIA